MAPEREVIFRQDHPPGQQGLSDFTDMGDVAVRIAGEPFAHRLYHFVLAYSGLGACRAGARRRELHRARLSACRTRSGRSAVPRSSTAPTASPPPSATSTATPPRIRPAVTRRCARHYGMQPTRNNLGVAHENGAIESQHGHLKRAVAQALMLRGSADFDSLDGLSRLDRRPDRPPQCPAREAGRPGARRPRAAAAAAHHRPRRGHVQVTSSSGFVLRKVFYTVPSRLIGFRLRPAHLR